MFTFNITDQKGSRMILSQVYRHTFSAPLKTLVGDHEPGRGGTGHIMMSPLEEMPRAVNIRCYDVTFCDIVMTFISGGLRWNRWCHWGLWYSARGRWLGLMMVTVERERDRSWKACRRQVQLHWVMAGHWGLRERTTSRSNEFLQLWGHGYGI